MKSTAFIKLRITGQNLNFDELTEKFRKENVYTHKKGGTFVSKYGETVTYTEDCFMIEYKSCGDFTEETEKFVTSIQYAAEYLRELAKKADVTLWISVYPESEQYNAHLSAKTLKYVADMGITLDLSCLFLKDFYDGNYGDR